MTEDIVTITNILIAFKDIILGVAGGAVAYLFDYIKSRRNDQVGFPFMPSSMLINMLLGAFVAYTVGTLLPLDITGRDAMVGFSGLTAYNILLVAESKFAEWIIDKLTGIKKK